MPVQARTLSIGGTLGGTLLVVGSVLPWQSVTAAPARAQGTQAQGTQAQDTQQTMEHRSETEEVVFWNGSLRLTGLWFEPSRAEGEVPAVVLLQGSGPSDRQDHWARSVVDLLLEAGVAVLLPDKRGSGGSDGTWLTADFGDLAEDAASAVAFVHSRPGIREDAVGLLGLSQGGRVAPVAAVRSGRVAFVVNLSGSATSFAEQVSWEMYHTFREAGLDGEDLEEALRLQVLAERYVEGTVSWERFQDALNEALAGPGREVAAGFPPSPDAPEWGFFRGVIDFDPVPSWRRVDAPVLVVYGETDRNAPVVRSAYRLIRTFTRTGHPDWTVRILPETGHGLWDPGATDARRLRLHPALAALLDDWIERVVR